MYCITNKIGNANRGKKRKYKSNLKLKELWKDENYRNKQCESHKGKHWWTNGVENILCEICPEGFYKGRIFVNSLLKNSL